jgi:hypothetical protein
MKSFTKGNRTSRPNPSTTSCPEVDPTGIVFREFPKITRRLPPPFLPGPGSHERHFPGTLHQTLEFWPLEPRAWVRPEMKNWNADHEIKSHFCLHKSCTFIIVFGMEVKPLKKLRPLNALQSQSQGKGAHHGCQEC